MKNNSSLERQGRTIVLLVMILSVLFLTDFSSASLGTYKINDCVDIKTILNSSATNISTISYPNSSVAVTNTKMSKNGQTFNYTFCETSVIGDYVYDYFDNIGNVYVNDFTITYTGYALTTEQVYIYLAALLFLVFLSIGLVFVINKLPSGDNTDEEGVLLNINMLKHVRPILWTFVWIIGIAILFIISNLGIAYLPNSMIGNLFFTLYRIFFIFTMVAVPVYFIWIFYKIFKDREVKKMIERGVEVRGKP
jgi:hypothetical protein